MIRRLQTFRKTLSKSWLSSASSFDDSTSVLDESLLLADSQLDLSRKDDDDDDDDDRPTIAGLCEELYSSGAWRVLPLLLLTGISLSIILPDLPSFCSNYFASKTGGRAIDCSGGEGTQAKECVDAHWQCVSFQSWILFLNNSVITFFFGPLLGKLSDTYGRRPFLVFGSFCGALPAFGFYLMSFGYTSYVAIYPFISLGTAFGNFGVSLAYVSDLVCLKYRTQALSIVLAELFLGVIFGPWLMALGDTRTRAMIAAAVAATNIFYSVCIPESLRKPLQSQSKRSLKSLFEDFCSLFKSRFFCLMAVIATIGSMVSEGQQDISAQYLQLVSGFTPKDQANLISVVGVAGLIVQLILVPLALKLVQRRWVGTGNDSLSLSAPASDSSLSLSLSLSLCVCLFICLREHLIISVTNAILVAVNILICFFSKEKPAAIFLTSLTFLGMLSFTVAAGLISKAVTSEHQGFVTGVIGGLRAQAYGLAPPLYSIIFRAFTQTGSAFPYFPGATYIFSAALMTVTATVALFLDSDNIGVIM